MIVYLFSNILILLFVFICHILCRAQSCQWQSHRTVNEGRYQAEALTFRVQRSIEICVRNKTIYQIRTSRKLIHIISSDWLCQSTNNFGFCSGNCSFKRVNVSIICVSTVSATTNVSFYYNNKNCDKAYWSSWNRVTSCSNSRSRVFTRIANDCDQIPFPSNYHVNGYLKKKEEPCQPLWSEWVTIFCNSTNNKIKEQVRMRKCLYGDGSKTKNTQLCSNESAIITEQNCLPARTQKTPYKIIQKITKRSPDTSSSFAMSKNKTNYFSTHLYTIVILIFIFIVFFFVVVCPNKDLTDDNTDEQPCCSLIFSTLLFKLITAVLKT